MKSRSLKSILAVSMVLLFGIALMSSVAPQKPWDVPAKFKTMKNPSKSDVAAGKELWNKNCASCHGKTGIGDGPKARTLETFPVDFAKPAFQGQTDGDIFYKTKTGRGEMPKYDGKIGDDEIWQIVNFTRTFKK
jgi:mono/diheme cytochrome c family protein